ncbi:MAG: DUF1588 domain-containing protein [Myxococcaceae bacterium]
MRSLTRGALIVAIAAALAGCQGLADFQPLSKSDKPNQVELPADAVVGVSGARRLTRLEYDATLKDLLGDDTQGGFQQLPEDVTDPFDNDYRTQTASSTLISAAEQLAQDAATRLLASPAKLDYLLQCTPQSPTDAACLTKFIKTFGRRALRRPLTDDEVARFLTLQSYAAETNDFNTGIELVIRAILQEPEFLYRIEIGTPVAEKPGVDALNGYEIATRLSYFLWGSTPPDWLIAQAEAGQLATTDQIRDAAQKLVADPKARARVNRFHALWLGYHQLPHPQDLTAALKSESDALVDRIVFDEKADYLELFKSPETFLTPMLATHYGLPQPTDPNGSWVSYGASGRKGILSQGAVLSQGTKFSDTSPTLRGKWVRNRLLCMEIPPPPPTVNVDVPPTSSSSQCKKDRYIAHANVGSCASCHGMMDPIGFGLEQYDNAGRFRTSEAALPQCGIDGNGTVSGMGDFNGPAGLADLLMNSGQLEGCVVKQVYRFAMGRREAIADTALLEKLTDEFKGQNRAFDQLLVDFVTDNTFAYRQQE